MFDKFCNIYITNFNNIDFIIKYMLDNYFKYHHLVYYIISKYAKYIKSTYLYDIYKCHQYLIPSPYIDNLDHFISNDLLELSNSNKYLITLMYPRFSYELAIILEKVILAIPPKLLEDHEFIEFYNKYTPMVKSAGKK
jgi:hypothetical protein